MLNRFLKYDKEDNIVFTGDKLEIFIPSEWFTIGLATIIGNNVECFGLLHIKAYDAKDKELFQEVLNLPTKIVISPDDITTRTADIGYETGAVKYDVCTFYKNSPIMSRYIAKNSDNVQDYLNMIMRAKITGIPYETLLKVWLKNLEINGVDLGVPNAILELILSEIYRNENNMSENYAIAKNHNPKLSSTAYKPANERQLCAKNSTFAAMSFEDIDSMITYSLNMSNQKKKQNISPIEKVIRY